MHDERCQTLDAPVSTVSSRFFGWRGKLCRPRSLVSCFRLSNRGSIGAVGAARSKRPAVGEYALVAAEATPDADLMSSRPNWAKSRRVRVDGTLRQKERPTASLCHMIEIDHLMYGHLPFLSGRYASSPGTAAKRLWMSSLLLDSCGDFHHVVISSFALDLIDRDSVGPS